jgi:hypothetical protein
MVTRVSTVNTTREKAIEYCKDRGVKDCDKFDLLIDFADYLDKEDETGESR